MGPNHTDPVYRPLRVPSPRRSAAAASYGVRRSGGSGQARRRAVAAVLVAVGLSLTACSGGGSSGDTQTNVATIALEAGESPTYILPSDPSCAAVNNGYFRRLMYKPLLWYGGVPGKPFAFNEDLSLVESPEYSHDGKKVTVTLKDFQWSDGEPVTTRDITFFVNLYKATKEKWGCYSPGGIPDNIVDMQVKSDKTMTFTLDRGYSPQWFSVNALAGITPLPHHAWGKKSVDGEIGDYDQTKSGAKAVFKFLTEQAESLEEYGSNPLWQVVDGPWKLKEFDPRGDIVFVPNENYSGPDKPRLSKFVEKRFTTEQAEFSALLSGNELTTGYIPSQNAARKEQVKGNGYSIYSARNFGISYIVLNHNSNTAASLIRQHYIRQALQHMINQPQYVEVAYNGNAYEVHGPVPIKPENPYTSDYVESVPYPYNPEKSKQLLEQHGWTVNPDGTSVCTNPGTGPNQCGEGIEQGQPLEFDLPYVTEVATDRIMQAFKSSAATAGITINLQKRTLDQLFAITDVCDKGEKSCAYEMLYYGGWTYEPYPTGENLYASGGSATNWNDEKADKLIVATQTEPGEKTMTEYQNYIAEQLPVLWMPRAQDALSVVDADLAGFVRDEQELFGSIYPQYWHFEK